MGQENRHTGVITITPPLTWAEIRNGPGVSDVRVRIVEDTDLYRPLVTAGLIAGTVDEYGDFDDLDDDAGDALIAEAIRALGEGA